MISTRFQTTAATVWLMEKAGALDLAYRDKVEIDMTEKRLRSTTPARSLGSLYISRSGPSGPSASLLRPDGRDHGTHQRDHRRSVFDRWRSDATYRPENLIAWAEEK